MKDNKPHQDNKERQTQPANKTPGQNNQPGRENTDRANAGQATRPEQAGHANSNKRS